MQFSEELKTKTLRFVTQNASGLLTAGGVAGTVATAVLTARATFRAADVIAAAEMTDPEPEFDGLHQLEPRRKVALVWKYYVPPVVAGSATIGSIVMANRISAQRAAALAAAYGLSETRFKEYRDKVAEKLTGPKKQAIEDDIAQDRVSANPPNRETVILAGGDVLCYDAISGRYFQSTVERIRKAESVINNELFSTQACSLSQFYDEIGLPTTTFSDMVGWNGLEGGAISLQLSTTMTPDEKPCIHIDFSQLPKNNYSTDMYDLP